MQKPKILLFDIDHTLYEGRVFEQVFAEELRDNYGVDIEYFLSIHRLHKNNLPHRSDFHPKRYLLDLEEHLKIPLGDLKKAFDKDLLHQQAVFAEVPQALEKLAQEFELGMFSEGYKHHQIQKITQGGLLKYFKQELVFIHRRKLKPAALQQIPKESLVIDDLPLVGEVLKGLGIPSIWINRTSESTHSFLPTIHSLNELDQFLG